MDPLGNQPAQPNPQPPIDPIQPNPQPQAWPQTSAPVANPVITLNPEVPRPDPLSAPVISPERPVEAWPPAGSPAAKEAEQISQAQQTVPNPTTTEDLGNEATRANQTQNQTPSIIPIVPVANDLNQQSRPQDMNGFTTSPAAQEIKDSVAKNVAQEAPMSDQQADNLFQEEPATKARKKHKGLKRILISLLVLLITAGIASGAYLFFYGNKVAQSYSDTSSVNSYKDAFSKIQTSLGKQPIDSAELEAGFNKLKVSTQTTNTLTNIPMGQLNPNYKKAQQLNKLEADYRVKALAYQTKYADFKDYLKALSDSFGVVSSLDDLKSIDLTKTTSEKMATDMSAILKDCSTATKNLGSSAKPANLSTASKSLQTMLINFCTEATDSLEDGPLALLTDKTGILNAADQAKMRTYLDAFGSASTIVASKDVDPNADIEALTTYQQSALDGATSLLQEAEAILKG